MEQFKSVLIPILVGVVLGTNHLMWMKAIHLWMRKNIKNIVMNATMISYIKQMYLLRFRQGDYNAKSDL